MLIFLIIASVGRELVLRAQPLTIAVDTLCASEYRRPADTLNLSESVATHRFTLQRSVSRLGACTRYWARFSPPKGEPVKLTLLSDEAIRLEPIPGPMTIEAMSGEQSYSPFHMVAGGLAYCTFSVLYAWAEHAKIQGDDIVMDVSWTFADDPHRVGSYDVRFTWPSLDPTRLEAAKRVAEMCTVHATLQHPPTIAIGGTGAASAT
jgi:uncharacterized OsmC-like protein